MLAVRRIDLITDKYLFRLAWRSDPSVKARNTRLCYISALIIGAFAGAYTHKHAGFLVVVAVSAGLKGVVTAWLATVSTQPEQ
jgi:hypothetical protein